MIGKASWRKSRARKARPVLERLDDRCLLTTATLTGGLLAVVGTEAADRIVLNFNIPRGMRGGIVNVPGVGRFPLNRVAGIQVEGGGGDDMIVINTRGRAVAPVPLWIDGGSGNDAIVGGRAREVIMGGLGDDIILSRGGLDQIDPGPGHNWVNGRIVTIPLPEPVVTPAATPTPASPIVTSPTPPTAPPVQTTPTPTVPQTPQIGNSSPDLATWSRRIIDLTNQQRRQKGLADLAINPKLMQAAEIQANQMAQFDRMQHELPGAKYPDLASRARAVGYDFAWFGENIAYNYPDPEGVMQGWMLSEGHRANILNPDYTEMGAAVVLGPYGRPYYAQVFGRPA